MTEAGMEVLVPLDWVQVIGRFRKDLGDVDSLARSMESPVGLINPITVTPDGRLVAGQRRLEAARRLGWSKIQARMVDTLDGAVERLTAERDENTERKPMTPEELVALGKALEELERPRAAERRREAAVRAGKIRQGSSDPALRSRDHKAGDNGLTRDKVGQAIGMSGGSYIRAKTIVEAAHDITAPPEEQEIAKAALADMNATGNIHGNYDKVRNVRGGRLGAPTKTPLQRPAQQRKALTNAVHTLSGMADGLALVDPIHPDITSGEAAQWVDGLSEARRVIESLIKRLRAHTQEG